MNVIVKTGFIIFLFHVLTGCSNKTYPTGNYQQTPVVADGELNEWSLPLRFGSSGGQVQYNVTNDNDNIYVSLETHDEATALKILRSGIDVYIDPSAGESKKICLAFPLANSSSPIQRKNMNAGNNDPGKNDFRQSLLIQAVSFNTTGFKNMENRNYDVRDKTTINVGLRSENNNGLAYEAVIPLKYVFENDLRQNSAKNISVGITINAMKGGGESHSSNGNSSGRSSGMHSGGHGGGRGGGGTYHRSNTTESTQTTDRTALFKEDANWYKFKLAVKK